MWPYKLLGNLKLNKNIEQKHYNQHKRRKVVKFGRGMLSFNAKGATRMGRPSEASHEKV